MHYPSTLRLQEHLWNVLTDAMALAGLDVEIVPTHPSTTAEIQSDGRIIIQPLNDRHKGKTPSRMLAQPIIEFVCYAHTAVLSQRLKETIEATLEEFDRDQFRDDEQRVLSVAFVGQFGAVMVPRSELFFSSVSYLFSLAWSPTHACIVS